MTKTLFALLFLCVSPCLADVRLPRVLGSNMVLQRDTEVTIWGWADAGEDIRIDCDWLETTTSVTADEHGKWRVRVETGEAGGPHAMTLVGKNTVSLQDLLFGEVWIGSGQSNMEMPLVRVSGAYTGIENAEQEVAEARYPEIRLFQAGNYSSQEALEDVQPGISMYGVPPAACEWRACTPETVPTFASTAYFFARELYRELGVPIGIIDASWGGTSAEAWTPASGLKTLGLVAELEQTGSLPQQADGKIPTRLYNGMIHPLRHLEIRGVIWYQGEGNVGRADRYRELFSTMIREWRGAFGRDFSFYFVQLAPFEYGEQNAAYLREAQLETMSLPGTGMVVTMDLGNLADIHPKNKQEVGRRLARWALAKDYGRQVVCSGPVLKESVFGDGVVRLRFADVGTGLATRDGEAPSHFEVAGEDQVFHPAAAVIEGDELILSSAEVAEPRAARYAFTSTAMPNLINQEGLPASPFRTDRW